MASTDHADGTPVGGLAQRGFDAKLPTTPLGKWSLWLAATFIVLFGINMVVFVGIMGRSTSASWQSFSSTYLPFYGVALGLVALAAGITALVALLKQKERSLITLVTLVPMLFMIMLLLGEFLGPAH